jgi:hypothetical protein
MIPKRLQSRQKRIEATPLKDRAQAKTFSRREVGLANAEEEPGNEKFDTFFDYEDDLAGLKSSSEQYSEMLNSEPYIVLEDVEPEENENTERTFTPIIMEEIIPEILAAAKNSYDNDKKSALPFKFIQCEFTKKDGNRCKRQAPKNSALCSSHRKYLKKQNNSK